MGGYKGEEKRVVIVGSGFAAVKAAQLLAHKRHNFDVTIIGPYDYLDINFHSMRALAFPDTAQFQVLPFDSILPASVTRVQGLATSVTSDKHIEVSTGQRIPYDLLLLATGSRYAKKSAQIVHGTEHAPTAGERIAELRAFHEKIRQASRIVIVGGGISGVELAAEIRDALPNKPIVIRTRSGRLAGRLNAKLQKAVQQRIESLPNITIETKEVKYDGGEATAEAGDLVLDTVGMVPNTEWLRDGALSGALNESGRVVCEAGPKQREFGSGTTGCVVGHADVFAFGDIASPSVIDGGESGFLTIQSIPVLLPNIVQAANEAANGKSGKKKHFYAKPGLVLNLGSKFAVGQVGNVILPRFICRKAKCADVTSINISKQYGHKHKHKYRLHADQAPTGCLG